MFKTLTTLLTASQARAEDRVRDAFAIELIDQKIRESDAALKAAKATLASLIQRQRNEARSLDALTARIADMTARTRAALTAGNDHLAQEAAQALAQMHNEAAQRRATCDRLDHKILRLRASVEAGHRRIIDLRQGAVQARAVKREQDMQMRLHRHGNDSAVAEAEDLIARVLGRDDPFEQAEILSDINRDLSHDGLADRMADAGLGDPTRITAAAILADLKSNL